MGSTIQKILIIDNRYENRYLLQILLEGNGYQTISATNGLDALEKLKTESIHAIISDILMPEMDGFQLCRLLKKDPTYKNLPFIFYTASYTEEKDRQFGLSLGADGYIIKPIEPDQFISLIFDIFSRFTSIPDTEMSMPQDRENFYSTYSQIIEKKLTKKLIQLEEQKEALQLNEKRYQHFFKIIQGIRYIYQKGNLLPLSFGGRVEEITGYTADEFLKGTLKWDDIIHPHDKKQYLKEREQVFNPPGNVQSMEYRILHKTGQIRWVHELLSPVSTSPPDIIIQGAISDNTQQVMLNLDILKSEENYRFLFNSMVEGVIFQDRDGIITDANQSAERILGLTREQLLGRASKDPRWKAIKEDFTDYPGEEHPSIISLHTGKESTGIMGVFNLQDENYHWIFINSVPVFSPGEEKPVQSFTTFWDITTEQNAKNALRAREKQYRELVENISDTLFIVDTRGIITYISPTATRYTGFDSTSYIGHHFNDFIYPDDQEKMIQWFMESLHHEIQPIECRTYSIEHKLRYLIVKGSPLTEDNAISGLSGIIVDISAEKEAEELRLSHTKEVETLLSIHGMIHEKEDVLFEYTLQAVLDITDSGLGLIILLSNSGTFVIRTCSSGITSICRNQIVSDTVLMSLSGLFNQCVISKESIVINNCSESDLRTVETLPAINRLIITPIIEDGHVSGIFLVANRKEDYTGFHAKTLITLGNALWDIVSKQRSNQEISRALSQVAKNMEQLATLNDSIRNPLAIIAAITDSIESGFQNELLEAVKNIDSIISQLDQGWIQSEKVRHFLIKHHQFTRQELDPE